MLRKIVALSLTFAFVLCMSVNAMTLNIPKEEYYKDITYPDFSLDDENAAFKYRLAFLKITDGIESDGILTKDLTINILKNAFKLNTLDVQEELSSNQELVKVLCDILNIEPVDNADVIRTHPDYGLIEKHYLPYYEAYAQSGFISDKKGLLRPNKSVTYESLFEMLYGIENEIYALNDAKVISGEVKRINYVNNTKTFTVQTEDYDVEIPMKKGRQTVYLKDGIINHTLDARIGESVNLIVNSDNEIVLVENEINEIDEIPNVEGIYKAKIYLYDYLYGRIIFNELEKFDGENFIEIPGKYSEFKVSDKALLYEYYRKTNGYYLNRDFLDINAYFIVDTNLKGENEIIYLNVVN